MSLSRVTPVASGALLLYAKAKPAQDPGPSSLANHFMTSCPFTSTFTLFEGPFDEDEGLRKSTLSPAVAEGVLGP